MKYEVILFDLDGVLTDSKEGITKAIRYALSKFDVAVDDLDSLEKYIGPPLQDSFAENYSFSEEEVSNAVMYYREYFSEKGMYENALYNGIIELLNCLKKQEVTLAIATSKPTIFTNEILKYFEIAKYFDLIVGSNLDGTMRSKAEIIEYALEQLGNPPTNKAVMIGDRKHDIIGAKKAKVHSIGVTYGYGSLEELQKEEPSFIVNTIDELSSVLIG